MISSFISRIVILVFGTLYPAYASYKAVRTKNVKEYVKWMMYWIVFALFTCTETFTDLFLSFWFPFYYELKIFTVIYFLSPATNGSSILYRKFVHPTLVKREQEIDDYIAKAKEQGCHTMLNLGSKGVTYATTLLMETAIRGGGGIVNQLQKSYSLNDLNGGGSLAQGKEYRDEIDHRDYKGMELMRRPIKSSPRRSEIESGDSNLYFTELDTFERNFNSTLHSPVLSAEENNSIEGDSIHGYSQRSAEDRLLRTSSLGATRRMRTRASSKATTTLPDRYSVAEGSPYATLPKVKKTGRKKITK